MENLKISPGHKVKISNHNYADTFGEPDVKAATRKNGGANEAYVYDDGTNDAGARDDGKNQQSHRQYFCTSGDLRRYEFNKVFEDLQ